MKLTLANRKVTLVLCPIDMRSGFSKLSLISHQFLNIDVTRGEDCVVFVNKSRAMVKVIFADTKGTVMLTRKLHQGRFQQLLTRAEGAATEPLTVNELERYLDGEAIQVKRQSLLKN